MSHIMPPSDPGLFDYQDHMTALAARQTSLDRLNQVVRWDDFEPVLQGVFRTEAPERGGRPRFDPLLMFKILVLQRTYNLSDEATELAVQERLTWHRFLGLHVGSRFPDAKTIWLFRERLTQTHALDRLFGAFFGMLERHGVRLEPGKIVDATLVPVPVQRNPPEENAQIKQGQTPAGWSGQTAKLRQKDTDARWTRKNGRAHFGYKNHIKVDRGTKLIEACVVTPANTHDSQVVERLRDPADGTWHGDSAYHGETVTVHLAAVGVINRCHRQGQRTRPLTPDQRAENRAKSTIRARVEHIFAAIRMQLHGPYQRCIGFLRNQQRIVLTNLVYNLHRLRYLAAG